jgi:membrane-associated phospholipid phosphatase
VLVAAYHSAFPQVLVLYLLLSFARRERRLAEFLTLLSVTSVVTGALILLAPAAGAYAHFAPARELFDGFSSDAGMWHYETLTTLRTQAPSLDFTKIEGLVTFPSYHTVLAIIMAYAFRGFRFIALPAVILNSIMIVSTLPEGGHYLVDIIAGAIVALAGIGVVRWEQRGRIWAAPAGATHGVVELGRSSNYERLSDRYDAYDTMWATAIMRHFRIGKRSLRMVRTVKRLGRRTAPAGPAGPPGASPEAAGARPGR